MRAVEIGVWWLVLVGVWLLTLTSFSSLELYVAAVCALPCAVAAIFARRAIRGRWRLWPGCWRWFLLVPQAVVADTAWSLSTLCRRTGGSVERVPLRPHDGDSVTRQALATLLLSSCPSTVVLDARAKDQKLLVHRLGRRGSALERAVRR